LYDRGSISGGVGKVKVSVLFTTASIPTVGPTQPPVRRVPAAVFLDVKRPVREADRSPLSAVEVKNACTCTYTPPIRHHGVVLS
jgi:hypothetical protein